MSIKKNINAWRRKTMHQITKNIGGSSKQQNIVINDRTAIKRVLIIRANHRLGNLLLITPLLQEVIAAFPESKIDLMVQGNLGPIIFENYKNVDKIIKLPKKPFKELSQYIKGMLSLKKQKYDLVINAVKGSSSGKLYTQLANANIKVFGEENKELIQTQYKDHMHIAKYMVYSFRDQLSKAGFSDLEKPIPNISLQLRPEEIAAGKKILKDIVKNEKKTIALFTYATDDKCYSEEWWATFYNAIKKEFADYNFVEILPIENISKILFKAPTFYSKDIREISSVIANTELFIGADSGIMHLGSAAQVPVVGLFSRDNQKKYEPYGNHSLAINTNEINTEGCINEINKILRDQ